MLETKMTAPGLRYRGNRPIWRATKGAVAAGYPVKNVNLSLYRDDPRMIVQRCERLQVEMLAWLSGRKDRLREFDGTIKSLIELYQTDEESPYHKLKSSTRKPYDVYARMIVMEIGARQIDDCDGRDVNRWFNSWSAPKFPEGVRQIPKARMAIAVLSSALSFGIRCRRRGCKEFKDVLDEMKFTTQLPRTSAPTAEEIVKARRGAHTLEHKAAALAYAIQFEGAVRQWDVIGEWIPMSEPQPSLVIDRGKKWIGPMWSQVDENLLFHFTPTKTQNTTAKKIVIDFKLCPMILEELGEIPVEQRKGPLIVNPATGLPYRHDFFRNIWNTVRANEGLNSTMWNRDLRAGGVTEGRAANASTDDIAKLVGHSGTRTTTRVYDRDQIEAVRRVAAARSIHRNKTQK
jgi:hypothetical protein